MNNKFELFAESGDRDREADEVVDAIRLTIISGHLDDLKNAQRDGALSADLQEEYRKLSEEYKVLYRKHENFLAMSQARHIGSSNASNFVPAAKIINNPVEFAAIPREFELELPGHLKGKPLNFLAVGCAGEYGRRGVNTRAVAQEIQRVAFEKEAAFCLFLGDNFYPVGPNDPAMEHFSPFYNTYGNATETDCANIPFFVALGNHGYNFRNKNPIAGEEEDVELAVNQVLHSYMDKYTGVMSPELHQLYSSKKIKLEDLQKWNMPSRYYAFTVGKDARVIVGDSNTYVRDYEKVLRGDPGQTIQNNQALWLEDQLKKGDGRQIILAWHHPAYYTPGKRHDGNQHLGGLFVDSGLYHVDKALLEEHGLYHVCYSNILGRILEKQRIKPNILLCAHEHNLSYYKHPGDTHQFIAGGGGGHVQNWVNEFDFGVDTRGELVDDVLEEHGFVSVQIDGRKAKATIHPMQSPEREYDISRPVYYGRCTPVNPQQPQRIYYGRVSVPVNQQPQPSNQTASNQEENVCSKIVDECEKKVHKVKKEAVSRVSSIFSKSKFGDTYNKVISSFIDYMQPGKYKKWELSKQPSCAWSMFGRHNKKFASVVINRLDDERYFRRSPEHMFAIMYTAFIQQVTCVSNKQGGYIGTLLSCMRQICEEADKNVNSRAEILRLVQQEECSDVNYRPAV